MFIGGSRKDNDLALTIQRSVNWYLETQGQGASTPRALIGAPGTANWAEVGAGPIKELLNFNDVLYCISGRQLFSIDQSGFATLLGTMDESNQPSISFNLNQIVITNGVNGYVYDTTSLAFSKISDPDFYSSTSVTYQDGYSVFNRTNTGQFFTSDIDDALVYDAIDFDEAVLRGDNLVAVVSDTRNVWLFGTQTMEPWQTSNQVTGVAFTPLRGAASLRGTAAPRSVVSCQLGVFFLGDDHNVYWVQGYTPVNIADDQISKELTSYPNLSDAYAFMMNMDGHWFYVLTLPTQKRTLVYDPEEKEWHERESYGLGYWRASCYAACYGQNFVGDGQSNKVGYLSRAVYTEYGDSWVAKRVTGVYAQKKNLITWGRVELTFPSGQVPQNVTHQARLSYSDDKGMTFSTPRIVEIGAAGKGLQRCIWWGLGSSRQRVFKLEVSTPANRDLLEEDISIEMGGI